MNDSAQLTQKTKQSGFTLIELLIVAAIIGILGSIAYPAYMDYIRVGNRSEGKAALEITRARLERFYSDNNAYATAAGQLPAGVDNTSETGKYTITTDVAGTFQSYTLTATLTGIVDTDCGNLTLASTGLRGSSAGDPDDCWSK